MKYVIWFFIFFVPYVSFACDQSSISITNLVDNGNGTYTYTLDVSVELGGLDATYFGFTLSFNSPHNSPSIFLYQTSITDSDLTSGSFGGSSLNGHYGSAINSTANDSDWNPYLNMNNVLSYEYGGLFGLTSNSFSFTLNVTVSGCVETIEFNSHVNSGSSSCIYTVSTGLNCAPPCSISSLAAGTQTACDPASNTYTQQVTVTYSNPPSTGDLVVNGQSFAITSSPQTVTLTNLTANAAVVDVTAQFSDQSSCTLTTPSLFTAPSPCSTPCNPDNGTWD